MEREYTQCPNWGHHSNNSLMNHKFLISEMKMNSQESVYTYGYNSKERGESKHESEDFKYVDKGGMSRIHGHLYNVQRLSE